MSLRVWLPLNGNLDNQGLDQVTVTNNGAVVDNNGKIGKCYSFGTGNSYIVIDSTPLKTFTEFSFACWIKIISWNTSYSTIFAAKNSTAVSWNNLIFSLLRSGSNSNLCFNISNGTNSTSTNCYTGTLSTNTWYHIVCTYEEGKIKLYQNGNIINTYNTTVIPNFNSIVNLWIGKSNENSYQSNNLLNDIRIYDHALSPLEVKQISQGLILHYPLNRNGWGQENLLKKSGFFKTFQGWTNNQSVTISVENNELKAIINQNTSTPGIKTTIPISLNAGVYTASLLIKVKNGGKDYVNFPFYMNNGSKVIYNGAYTKKEKRGEYIYEEATFTLSSNVENVIFYILSSGTLNGETWYIKNIKLELGQKVTPWCPNSSDELYNTLGLNDNIQYDTSGYGNNGIRTGTFSWTSDTPKYNASQYFNNPTGTSTLSDKIYISASPNLYSPSAITVGFWFKKEAITRGGLFTTGPATTSTTTLAIHDYDLGVKVISSDNTTLSMGSYDTFIPSTNIWYYYVITFDGINAKIYINGDLKTTKSYSGTKTLQNIINITLGANSAGGVYRSTKGYYSDFRIYVTALSAEDVKSLYQNSAYIDNQGNIYGAIYEEV